MKPVGPPSNPVIFTNQTISSYASEGIDLIIATAKRAFDNLGVTLNTFVLSIKNFIWPLREMTEEEKAKRPKTILGRAVALAIEGTPPRSNPGIAQIAPFIQVANIGYTAGLSWQLATLPENRGLIGVTLNANRIQTLLRGCFYKALDKEFLKRHHFNFLMDPLDRSLYDIFVVSVCSTVQSIGAASQPLYFTAALLGTLPPVQHAVMNSRLGKNVRCQVRSMAKKPLVFGIKWLIKSDRFKNFALSLADDLGNRGGLLIQEKFSPEFSAEFSPEFSSHQMNSPNQLNQLTVIEMVHKIATSPLGRALTDEHLVEPMADAISTVIDQAADGVAEMVVNKTVSMARQSFELYFVNKALIQTLINGHPLLAGLGLLANGGSNQSLQELVLRVSGAAVMISTGSTFLPMVIIHAPPLIEYAARIRGRHLANQGILQDPAIEVIKNSTATLFQWFLFETTEVTEKPRPNQGRWSAIASASALGYPSVLRQLTSLPSFYDQKKEPSSFNLAQPYLDPTISLRSRTTPNCYTKIDKRTPWHDLWNNPQLGEFKPIIPFKPMPTTFPTLGYPTRLGPAMRPVPTTFPTLLGYPNRLGHGIRLVRIGT
jgi:hypothetical protein